MFREILASVVDDMVGAEGAGGVDFGGAADGGDFGIEGFGDLDGEGAHAAGGTVDQNFLAWLDAAVVPKTLQGGKGRDGQGCGVFEGPIGGLEGQSIFGNANVFGEGAAC